MILSTAESISESVRDVLSKVGGTTQNASLESSYILITRLTSANIRSRNSSQSLQSLNEPAGNPTFTW